MSYLSERQLLEVAVAIIQQTIDRLKAEEESYSNLPPKEVIDEIYGGKE